MKGNLDQHQLQKKKSKELIKQKNSNDNNRNFRPRAKSSASMPTNQKNPIKGQGEKNKVNSTEKHISKEEKKIDSQLIKNISEMRRISEYPQAEEDCSPIQKKMFNKNSSNQIFIKLDVKKPEIPTLPAEKQENSNKTPENSKIIVNEVIRISVPLSYHKEIKEKPVLFLFYFKII